MRNRSGEAGFTLLEVMIAAVILTIAAGGIAMLSASMERNYQLTHEFELAEETARRVVEDIQYRARDSFPKPLRQL